MSTPLNDRQRHVVTLLCNIADILHMVLFFHDQNGQYGIHGHQTLELPVSDAFVLTLKTNVHASSVNVEDGFASVLLRVKGDLWVYVACVKDVLLPSAARSEIVIYFYILDGAKLYLNDNSAKLFRGLQFGAMLKRLEPGIVRSYLKTKKATEWSWTNAPVDNLEQGLVILPEGECGRVDQAGGDAPQGN